MARTLRNSVAAFLASILRGRSREVEAVDTLATRDRELEAAAAELRNLANHLFQAREEERHRMALDIHDELGQRLTAMSLGLHWAVSRAGGDRPLRSHLEELIELNKETISAVQGLSSQLRPRLLDDIGLKAALEWLVSDLGKRANPKLSLVCELDDGPLDPEVATTLFRLVQESLSNILRHAEARGADLTIRQEGDRIALTIEDDGIGIGAEQRDDPHSYGLIGMRERVLRLGGSFSIIGEAGKGTTIRVILPRNPKAGRSDD
jgi:signal transduction histidine kinase